MNIKWKSWPLSEWGNHDLKKLTLSILLVCWTTLLIGCQSNLEEMHLLGDIEKVSIAKSNGCGMNEQFFATLTEKDKIAKFQSMLTQAEGKKIANRNEPDFDILIQYNDGEHLLHLILGEKGEKSSFSYIGHEGTAYFVSPENTDTLREWIK